MRQSSPEKITCEHDPKGTSEKKILRPSGGGKRATHTACERRPGRAALPPFEGGISAARQQSPFRNSPRYKHVRQRSAPEGPSLSLSTTVRGGQTYCEASQKWSGSGSGRDPASWTGETWPDPSGSGRGGSARAWGFGHVSRGVPDGGGRTPGLLA